VLPRTVVVGLPDSALYQARDRCKATVSNSGQEVADFTADHQISALRPCRRPAAAETTAQPSHNWSIESVVTLLSGIVFAGSSAWRIFGDRWLRAKLGLYAATAALGAALLGPSLETLFDRTESSSPGERNTRWRLAVLAGLQAVMLLTAGALGVFKGSARARRLRTGRGGRNR
jgi:hypothetical protein